MSTPLAIARRQAALGLAATVATGGAALRVGAERKPADAPGGEVKQWLREPGDAPFAVPRDYVGLHSDHGLGGSTPSPTYPYDAVRSHDVSDTAGFPATQWARIEQAPGRFDWRAVDDWIAAHPGKTRIWVLFGCPLFYQKYPGEPWRYPYLPGGGSPPRDPRVAAAFVTALLARHPGKIAFVEIWNEPNFGWKGHDPSRDRWTPTMEKPGFFTGTASDLAGLARAIKAVLPAGVKLMAGAFEGQGTSASKLNSLLRFSAAPDGAGGIGRDHVDVLSVHCYTYKNDPNRLIDELKGYDARFREAGYAPTLPRYVTECGAEAPQFWTAATPPLGDKLKNIKRWCMIPAAFGYSGVYLYKHSILRTLGDPAKVPEIGRAIGSMRAGLKGKRIMSAALMADDSVRLTFDDGSQLQA